MFEFKTKTAANDVIYKCTERGYGNLMVLSNDLGKETKNLQFVGKIVKKRKQTAKIPDSRL